MKSCGRSVQVIFETRSAATTSGGEIHHSVPPRRAMRVRKNAAIAMSAARRTATPAQPAAANEPANAICPSHSPMPKCAPATVDEKMSWRRNSRWSSIHRPVASCQYVSESVDGRPTAMMKTALATASGYAFAAAAASGRDAEAIAA